MALGSSSLVNIAYQKEASFGVIPKGSTNPKLLRVTGESLDYSINKEASEEINSSRTVSSMIPLSASASGGLETEISYLEYDPFFESTLQSTFVPHGTNGVSSAAFTPTFVSKNGATPAKITLTLIQAKASGIVDATSVPLLKKGQWFTLSGSNTGAVLNDTKLFRIHPTLGISSDATTTTITLDPSLDVVTGLSTPGSSGTGAATAKLSSSRLVNGKTQSYFTIERQSSDVSQYWAYTGMTPSSMDISISSGARSTLSFSFMGKSLSRKGTTNFVTDADVAKTPDASKTYEIHSGSTGPSCVIWVDGAPLSDTFVQSINLTYDNTLREQTAICNLDAIGIGSGTISATGTMEVYFSSGALYDKFANNDNVSVIFSTTDTLCNGYVFTLPKVNFSKVSTNAGGKDADMMLSLEFTALNDNTNADATLRNLIQVDRVGAAAA